MLDAPLQEHASNVRIFSGRTFYIIKKNDVFGKNNVKKTTNRTFATILLVEFQDKSS